MDHLEGTDVAAMTTTKTERGLGMTEDLRAEAFALFADGVSTNQVATKLFKGAWAKAKKLRDEYDAEQGGATEAEPGADGDEAEPNWTLQIEVPAGALDALVATFTEGEKATAVQAVLQSRVDGPA